MDQRNPSHHGTNVRFRKAEARNRKPAMLSLRHVSLMALFE
jgi:hypothetical protein